MKKILITLAAAMMCICAAAQPAGQGRPGGQNGQGANPFGNMTQEQVQEMLRRMNQPPADDSFEMQEKTCISAGNMIYGEAFFPKAPGKHPAIIMSHGYGGSHTGFYDYISELAKEGYICYCYDFAGGGRNSRSEGDSKDMSILTERQNLIDVLEMVLTWDNVDKDNVFLMGESQGGCVSAITAPYVADKINSIVLAYPAFCIADDGFASFKTLDDVPEVYNFMGLNIGKAYYRFFYEDGYDVYDDIVKYKGNVLIVHGTNDSLVKPEYSARAVNVYDNAELHLIFGAGHGFSTPEQKELYRGYVRDFLNRNRK